jgi:hypothetical protein
VLMREPCGSGRHTHYDRCLEPGCTMCRLRADRCWHSGIFHPALAVTPERRPSCVCTAVRQGGTPGDHLAKGRLCNPFLWSSATEIWLLGSPATRRPFTDEPGAILLVIQTAKGIASATRECLATRRPSNAILALFTRPRRSSRPLPFAIVSCGRRYKNATGESKWLRAGPRSCALVDPLRVMLHRLSGERDRTNHE